MVLNQNEYTMTSLGFNYQKPSLFLPNQTHPPSFLINKIDSLPLLSHPTSLFLSLSSALRFPAAKGAAAPTTPLTNPSSFPSSLHHSHQNPPPISLPRVFSLLWFFIISGGNHGRRRRDFGKLRYFFVIQDTLLPNFVFPHFSSSFWLFCFGLTTIVAFPACFPANQRRPTSTGSVLSFLISGEALSSISYLF